MQPAGDFLVERRDPGARIDDEQREVGALQRHLGLHAHPARQRGGVLIFPTGGIDDGEIEPQQMRLAKAAVTGDPGLIVDQRQFFADQPVEERRFAHVGATDNDDLREFDAGHEAVPVAQRAPCGKDSCLPSRHQPAPPPGHPIVYYPGGGRAGERAGAGCENSPLRISARNQAFATGAPSPSSSNQASTGPLSFSVSGWPLRSMVLPACTRIQPSEIQYSSTLVRTDPLKRMPIPRCSLSASKYGLRGWIASRSGGTSSMAGAAVAMSAGRAALLAPMLGAESSGVSVMAGAISIVRKSGNRFFASHDAITRKWSPPALVNARPFL